MKHKKVHLTELQKVNSVNGGAAHRYRKVRMNDPKPPKKRFRDEED